MKKSTKTILIILWSLLGTAGVLFAVLTVLKFLPPKEQAVEKEADGTLACYSEFDLFAKIPAFTEETVRYENATDNGAGTYGINAYDTDTEMYRGYLKTLEENGFKKYTDNGDGMDGFVYKAWYEKDGLYVSVAHLSKTGRTLITACEKAWSDRLLDLPEWSEGAQADASTKLYLPELYALGASMIYQLKNGHFILNDGGVSLELPYLLDDLERLAPEGEKPIIDAWFISHGHTDHMGVFMALFENKDQLERISVENVFFNDVSKEDEKYLAKAESDMSSLMNYVRGLPSFMKRADGSATESHEISIGDRLYFDGLTVDVVFSSELNPREEWLSQNGMSLWLMYTVEGQKVLFSFDGTWPTQKTIMKTYDRSYFDLTVYQPPHHGYDTFNEFTDYLSRVGTLLYTNYQTLTGGSEGYSVESAFMQHLCDKAGEVYTFGNGTVVLTFPYEAGTAETLAPREWKYNAKDPTR